MTEKTAKIITITSGKGGVGKSLFTVNFAVACAKQGKKVLVIDGDLGLANLHILLNIHPEHDLLDIIEKKKELKDIVVSGPQGVDIVPGASGIFKMSNMTHAKRKNLMDAFQSLESSYDYILIDTEAGISHNVAKMVSVSDEVIVVTTPDITAMADAYAAIKVFNNRDILKKVSLVINRVKSFTEGDVTFNKINTVCEKFLSIKIKKLGYIFEDHHVIKESIKQRIPYIIRSPKSKPAICIKSITTSFIGQNSEKKETNVIINRLAQLLSTSKKEEVLVGA